MDSTPKRKPEAPETAPGGAPTATAKSGARAGGNPTFSQKLWGTADAGLTTDEIMAMTRGRD